MMLGSFSDMLGSATHWTGIFIRFASFASERFLRARDRTFVAVAVTFDLLSFILFCILKVAHGCSTH